MEGIALLMSDYKYVCAEISELTIQVFEST